MNDANTGARSTNGHDHPSCVPIDRLLEDCEIRRSRASGPGGQHRNKVETAIHIHHRPTGISALATERRSQDENRRVAIQRLRIRLAVEHRTVKSETVEPSDLWVSRCRSGRIQCNERHEDFPSILAEALNAVDAKRLDVRKAAAALGCSSSQLIRFLAKTPEAFEQLNNARLSCGLHKLRP
jgi:protein subunit release factor B